MSASGWKQVEVVVYPADAAPYSRMEETLQLPIDAGFEDLLDELARVSPQVYGEVCTCVARARMHAQGQSADPLESTLDHYFGLGCPILCPELGATST